MADVPVPPSVVVVKEKRGWGCWGCGCAVAAVVAILVIVLLVFGGRSLYALAKNYTSAQPMPIATTDAGDPVLASAQQKVAAFEQAYDAGQPASLQLTGDEIDTLIARDPAYAKARGHLHVNLKDDAGDVQLSILLGDYEKTFLPDRYFNANATLGLGFDPSTHTVQFDVRMLQLGDLPLPASSTASFNQVFTQNINSQLQANPTARAFINRVQKMNIENGELVIETK
jgi:hypothetical protein